MKTAAPPVRNPDPQLAAAGIDTSRLDADTNNSGPRLGLAWSPAGEQYVVRGGYGLFYGRTPSIMLGTAHSNNGINIVSLTFTGDAVPTYPQTASARSRTAGTRRGRPSSTSTRTFANAQLMQASAAFEWQFRRRRRLTVDLSVRATATSCRARSTATSARFGARRSRSPDSSDDLRLSVPRRRPAVRQLHARDCDSSRRPSRATTASPRVEPAPARPLAVPRRLHARQGRGHGARRHRRRPGQRRRRREVRLEPARLRRRPDRRATTTSVIASCSAASTTPTASTTCTVSRERS